MLDFSTFIPKNLRLIDAMDAPEMEEKEDDDAKPSTSKEANNASRTWTSVDQNLLFSN